MSECAANHNVEQSLPCVSMNLNPRIHGTRYFPFSADGRENGATETGPRWLWWKLLIGSGRVVGHSESAHPGPKSPVLGSRNLQSGAAILAGRDMAAQRRNSALRQRR